MKQPRIWVGLNDMLFLVIERDIHLVMKVFKDAMDEIADYTYLDEDLRLLRLPIDFYEAAVVHYAKICPLKTLVGAYGLNNLREGDTVIHVNFDDMCISSQIAGISPELRTEKPQVAAI